MEEVSRVDLVNRDRPQGRIVEIAKVLFLSIGRPGGVGIRDVVIRAARFLLERARYPHARERPSIELWCRGDDDGLPLRAGHQPVSIDEGAELFELLLR